MTRPTTSPTSSVKPNVGHLDRASGVTGLIKVVQSLRHELLPGTRHFATPNREIDFDAGPFLVGVMIFNHT